MQQSIERQRGIRDIRTVAWAGLIGAAFLLVPAAAWTQEWSDGLYLRAYGGASALSDDDARLSSGGRAEASYDTGFATGLGIGYAFTDNLSGELEYMYRSADVSSFSTAGFGTSGDFASVIVTANALYSFDGWDVTEGRRLRPYLGAGIGVTQEIDYDVSGGTANGSYSSSGDFVYQLRAGLSYELTDAWRLGTEFRFLDAGSVSMSRDGGGRDLEAKYQASELLFSVGYDF